jgi:predicted RNA-binding Zn ribbon-like protein
MGEDDGSATTAGGGTVSKPPSDDAALRFTVDFLNTYDLFPDVIDRLTGVDVLQRLARRHALPEAERLRPSDLDKLRELRGRLYRVFAGSDARERADALNDVLASASASPRVVVDSDGSLRLAAYGGSGAVDRLAVALADALTRALATGPDRLRTCRADPCRCVYVDRTRANRQRYCCELCNDRMAAAAYRRRQRPV